MPRYTSFQLQNYRLLGNTPPISALEQAANYKNLLEYANLANDLKLSWDGDIRLSDSYIVDFELAYTVEAFVQNLYHRLITQVGRLPDDDTFGWNFEYLYQLNVEQQSQLLAVIIKDVENSIKNDPDVLFVADVTGQIVVNEDYQTHNIEITVTVQPKGIKDLVEISLVR